MEEGMGGKGREHEGKMKEGRVGWKEEEGVDRLEGKGMGREGGGKERVG